jgi:SPASM domain peptide maturase of grasp-with-spasm system
MKKRMNKYLPLFGNVQIISGNQRSLVVDTFRNKYYLVPNTFATFVKRHKKNRIQDIYSKYPDTQWEIITEYIDFLIQKDLVYLTDNPLDIKKFSSMSLEWDYYGLICNFVLELRSMEILKSMHEVITELNEHSCMYIQLIFHCTLKNSDLYKIAEFFKETEFISIELFFQYEEQNKLENIDHFFLIHQRFSKITLFNSPLEKIQNFMQGFSSLIHSSQNDINSIRCGLIDPIFFTTNLLHFTESQHHNTCLNRKISIDINGDIKNCPSMAKSYGNIRDTKLIDVVNNPEFQKVWHIKKDEINKCKDCEFRHICTDCRAYIENPDDQYSAPLKCGYNPYTCEWEEWSTNPLKQQAIDYYGMREIV